MHAYQKIVVKTLFCYVFNKVQLAELFVLFCQRCVRAGVQDATHNVVDDNDEPSSTRDDVSPSPKRDRTSAEDDDVTTPSLCRNAASTQTATVVRGDNEKVRLEFAVTHYVHYLHLSN